METENAQLREELAALRSKAERMASFNQSLKALQGGYARLANMLGGERGFIEEVSSTTQQSSQQVLHGLQAHNELLGYARQAEDHIDGLKSQTEQIGNIVSLISGIAQQTNLLALNAAIEAARAYEQGRGFAVVADEVRKLAERTSQATADIEHLVEGIGVKTDVASRAAHQLGTLVGESATQGREAADSLQRMLNQLIRLEQVLETASLIGFAELAKIDHNTFKFELYRVFLGLAEKRSQDVNDHQHCRLGKWFYEGDGKQYFSHLVSYRDLEPPHAAFHQAAREALLQKEQHNQAAAEQALDVVESTSLGVIDAFDHLSQSALAQVAKASGKA
ncbi:chemotaxis protein [Paludibacterium sp. dN 18-1]|uniref:Chemotaxis protein n=2 Tax=Paludibacterium denitrificans TaxID=2675226 RepID=A0A844GF38_9NEIS|nr:methyl-accepting chemotaxis protein [Paludibacterium denitrificans]MTD33507.1 chemotaxis protein [Paludibacterium denitrificans]